MPEVRVIGPDGGVHELPGEVQERVGNALMQQMMMGMSAFPGAYGDPGFRPKDGLPQLTGEAAAAVVKHLVEGAKGSIKRTMGPLYGEMEGTSEDVMAASMMGLPGRVKVGKVDVLEGIKSLQRPGQIREMVSLMKLSDKLGVPKAELDARIMELVQEGKLDIHKHDYPAGMKPHEKETALVLDDPLSYREDKKAYYNAVSIRPDEI